MILLVPGIGYTGTKWSRDRLLLTDRTERMCSNRVSTGFWGKGTANAW